MYSHHLYCSTDCSELFYASSESPRDFPPRTLGLEFSFAHQKHSAEPVTIAPQRKGGEAGGGSGFAASHEILAVCI